jgi:hypothetical protein
MSAVDKHAQLFSYFFLSIKRAPSQVRTPFRITNFLFYENFISQTLCEFR